MCKSSCNDQAMIFSCSIKLSRHRQAPWLSQATCTHSFYRQAFSPASSQQVVTPLLYRQLGQSRLLKDSSVIAPSSPQVSEWLGVQTSLQAAGGGQLYRRLARAAWPDEQTELKHLIITDTDQEGARRAPTAHLKSIGFWASLFTILVRT